MTGRYALLLDFGSTYTKVTAVDRQARRTVFTGRTPSTVATDARVGLTRCLEMVRTAIGAEELDRAAKLASSSAAGGLRMGVVGLSRTLSAQAARTAAFGAGGKLLAAFAGRLTPTEVAALEAQPLEILLLCGGYEGGGTSAVLHNAGMLARSALRCPVIYGGNSAAGEEVRRLLAREGRECWITGNLIPAVGQLRTGPAEAIIREVFLRRIINMKGLDKVSGLLDRVVMPTPAAVLAGAELLSRGTAETPGLGEFLLIDVGGATTDVYSCGDPPPFEGAKPVGTPEPYAKRTVEGDLGLRESAPSLCREIGPDRMARETGLTGEDLQAVLDRWTGNHEALAETGAERAADRALTEGAVRLSVRRHAGRVEAVSSAGVRAVQRGKNLTGVTTVIGTGGPLLFGSGGRAALRQALSQPEDPPEVLLPRRADLRLDRDYVFYAAGLLREIDPEAALAVLYASIGKEA